MFFQKWRKATDPATETGELSERLQRSAASDRSARALADQLVERIEDFVVEAEELESSSFVARLKQFRRQLSELPTDAGAVEQLAADADFIAEFSTVQSAYLQELEQELRHIVALLTDAVVTLDSENRQYHLSIGGKLDSLSQISRLNDLRQLKSELGNEIREFRDFVRRKRNSESSTMDLLSGQVESLRVELEQARDDSMRDALTGVFNRRAVDQQLAMLLEKTGFRRKRFSVAIVDIDNFKSINDIHGHAVGDRVLLAVTGVLHDSIRSDDFLGRLGGDEFVLIFRGATLRNAERAAQKILEQVAATDYTIDSEHPENSLALTISIGVTEARSEDSVETLLRRADEAMYQAKREGRNAVIVARPD